MSDRYFSTLKERDRAIRERDELIKVIKNWFKVEGRYHSQIAAAKMAELVGLPAQYPENYKKNEN